jgi:hypothetical protein
VKSQVHGKVFLRSEEALMALEQQLALHEVVINNRRATTVQVNVSKSFKKFQNVSKCFQMFPNVSKCFQMFPNVSKCFQMFPNV